MMNNTILRAGVLAALAQQGQEAVEYEPCDYHRCKTHGCDGGCIKKTAAPAPQAQPVAPHECKTEAEKLAYAAGWWKALESVRLGAQPVAAQGGESLISRLRHVGDDHIGEVCMVCHEAADMLEAALQSTQTAQPLTDEQIIAIMESLGITVAGPASDAVIALTREVEAAHGIKKARGE